MEPLAASIRTAEHYLSSSASGEEAVVVGSYLFCKLIYEVTCNLDTQLRAYRDPVETGFFALVFLGGPYVGRGFRCDPLASACRLPFARFCENHFVRIAKDTNSEPSAVPRFADRTALLSKPANRAGIGAYPPRGGVPYRHLSLPHRMTNGL
jgi:hypothetical protein